MNIKKLLGIDTDQKEREVPKNPILELVEKGIKDGKYLLYFCKLVPTSDNNPDRLEHFVSISDNFKEDDIPLACDNMRSSAGDIVKRRKEIKKGNI